MCTDMPDLCPVLSPLVRNSFIAGFQIVLSFQESKDNEKNNTYLRHLMHNNVMYSVHCIFQHTYTIALYASSSFRYKIIPIVHKPYAHEYRLTSRFSNIALKIAKISIILKTRDFCQIFFKHCPKYCNNIDSF